MRYVRALYEVRGVAGVEMELSGLLSTKVARATTKVRATYYCRPVSVAVGPVAYTVADVPCLDQLDAPAHEARASGPLVLFAVLLLSIGCPIAHAGAGADGFRLQVAGLHHGAEIHLLWPQGNGAWVPLHRPYGPCSSSADKPPPSLVEMLRWDQVRTEHVRRKTMDGEADDVLDPDEAHVEMIQVDYMLQGSFGIGSGSGDPQGSRDGGDPMFLSQTMAIDTTVDVPWIQCLPCPFPQCYPQRNAYFDPKRSSTAAAVRCGSRACRALGAFANGCSNNNPAGECQYLIKYNNGRATAGTYMTDTLTISPSTTFLNFRAPVAARADGPRLRLGNAFSYCVPQSSASGFLSLGGPADGGASTFATTPLLRNAEFINPSIYIVRLQGIIVAGRRLNVPRVVFSGGTVMDSSSIVTQLPPTAYLALRRAFRRSMRAYTRRGPMANLDTCYDFGGFTNLTVPAVSLVFDGGAVVKLDPVAVLLEGCLAFTPTRTDFALGFMGNVQQQTHEVLFDVAAGAVGFRRGAC
ncbi:hypothetical protein QYE76_027575 [Lolium multiflorum]|uniref:Peptidase A1 domain-containing protein n=1 Tax=Lolium multiflorum TaxID=4521 RepID=A0AAD8VDQ2_LOLMU|nr:hypothetical protein QYE76_027575 [Lolium multiflorum]